MLLNRVLLVGPTLAVVFVAQPAFAQQTCESLTGLKLQHATVTSATMMPEGPLPAPAGANAAANAQAPLMVPARCDVRGVIRPSPDSEIKFAVWLPPAAGWNGKYRQEGNGGWAGNLQLRSMVDPLKRGYVSASTDDGHESGGVSGASWAVGHPEKLIDFGHRAVHETSVQAKAIVRAFYGKDPDLSYFFGCSDGGREALMEAQRYPQDFDGIIAAAPANNWSHLFTSFVWNEQALTKTPDSGIGPSKLPAIQKAVLAACDKLDGVKDGLLEDPRACKFDPAVLACKGVDKPDCLTPPQVTALKQLYGGPRNPKTGEKIYPGMPPGAEAAAGTWNTWITPADPTKSIQSNFGNTYYGQAVFEDPKWDFRKADFDADVKFADAKVGSHLSSTSPDLRSYRARGGKLIQYHGWGDAAISALNSIDYYEATRSFMTKFPDARGDTSKPIEDFYRLFMIPGMGHCGSGYGPNRFGNVVPEPSWDPNPTRNADSDVFAALERWVEGGIAPEQLIGRGVATDDPSKPLSRPLCLYPKVAQYKGSGDINNAASFTCALPATR